MASPSASAAEAGPPSNPAPKVAKKVDPILRNVLRYTVSARDYHYLHKYLISRAPALRKKAPTVSRFEAIVRSDRDFNAAAVRASLRVFLASQTGLTLWEMIGSKLLAKGQAVVAKRKTPFYRSPNLRLSLSLSTILLLHRLLYRFFTLLRENLLTDNARPFRVRNPRVSRALVSRLAPAIGSSLAGFMLGVYPSDQLRITVAVYTLTRALEFLYNKLDDDGWLKDKPWWFGSWLIMPVASGQLLHAFVFDRDCFPKAYGDFILNNTPNYIRTRPKGYPADLAWPGRYEIVDSLANMARLNHPPFVSPILFPDTNALPSALSTISPIVSPAHPAITHLSCAVLHPHDPSCLRTYLSFFLLSTPKLARFFFVIFSLFSLPRYKAFLSTPVSSLNKLGKSVLRMTAFVSGAVGTSWGMICFFQALLPRGFLPTQRYFVGGFVGGLWGWLERTNGRAQFLYTARASIDSAWKVAGKRGWVRGVRNGDVWLFVASLALINSVFELSPASVTGGVVRRGLSGLRGRGLVDPVEEKKEDR